MNSWQTGKEESHINLGEFVMIPPDDRGTSWDLSDTSVTDTWELADFSSLVPKGTKGLYIFINFTSSDAQDKTMVVIKDFESSSIGTGIGWPGTGTIPLDAEIGASGQIAIGARCIILAQNGKFYYRRYNSGYVVDNLYFKVYGYFI